jgi:hypothetical protein
MANLSPPSLQTADVRPISFMLVDPTTPAILSEATSITLAIRPEDLTRTDPSRVTVTQTLAGAWMDNFGSGIPSIVISGHTGWRRTQEGTATPDGIERWLDFRALVYDNWHARKQNAIKAGRDPDQVQLIFADQLDDITCIVAPNPLVLRRNRARPLLYQYQLTMIVLDDNVNPPSPAVTAQSAADQQAAALASITISTARLTAYEASLQTAVPASLTASLKAFVNKAVNLYLQVSSTIVAVNVDINSVLSVAHLVAQVGMNTFHTIAAITTDTFSKALLMQAGAEFSNLFCIVVNAVNQQVYYEDYTPLYGSSNCSSTNGGDAPSVYWDSNPFLDVVPTLPTSPVAVSPSALAAMHAVAANDPVLSPLMVAQLASYLTAINAGLRVTSI